MGKNGGTVAPPLAIPVNLHHNRINHPRQFETETFAPSGGGALATRSKTSDHCPSAAAEITSLLDTRTVFSVQQPAANPVPPATIPKWEHLTPPPNERSKYLR